MSSIWQLSYWKPQYDCGTPGLYRSPMLSVIGNALRVSEPMCKYHHSEGWEKISERDSIINIEIRYVVAQDVRMGDID